MGVAHFSYTAGTGGTISGTASQTIAHGGSGSSVTAVANSGYYFTGWSDGITSAARIDSSITADKSVSANFAQPVYNAPTGYTYCADEGGSFSYAGVMDVAYGVNGVFNYLYGKTGSVTFNNTTFGDPFPGVVKKGYYKVLSTPVPTATPTPVPTATPTAVPTPTSTPLATTMQTPTPTPVDDYGNDIPSANTTALNITKTGSIDYLGDKDYFKFTVSQSGMYTLFSSGATDIVGSLYDSSGVLIEANDDFSDDDRNFFIKQELTEGTYYLLNFPIQKMDVL